MSGLRRLAVSPAGRRGFPLAASAVYPCLTRMRQGALIAGKYRLRRLLGEGASGEVWAALNERTEREVALKVIARADAELRERALREARACGRVNHRNVVEILDAGETEHGDPFLAMQLLEGETLGERLRRERRLAGPLAAAIALDVARGLGAAHAAGVVHRDLKPSNIFLHREQDTGKDLVKVLDFGVSKMLLSGGPPQTRTGDIVGSPAYMSPEQARADRALDHRTDLWSLGVVLFEVLTGERPFPSKNITVVSEIVSAPIPPVAALVPDVDPRLASIVARCLERDRDRRIQTAQEVAALLLPLAAAEDVRATGDRWQRPPGSSCDLAPPAARRRPAEREEDLIPTLAVGGSVVPAAVAAAIAAGKRLDDAPPSSRPFRPVPTTLVDRSRPPPGHPAAMPQAARLESSSALQAQRSPLESTVRMDPQPAMPGPSRGPLVTQNDADELSTAQMPPAAARARFHPPAPPAPGAAPQQDPRMMAQPPGPPPRFGLKKGDATLFLVGVTSALTILALVLAVLGIGRLFSGKDAPPTPPSASSASHGAAR